MRVFSMWFTIFCGRGPIACLISRTNTPRYTALLRVVCVLVFHVTVCACRKRWICSRSSCSASYAGPSSSSNNTQITGLTVCSLYLSLSLSICSYYCVLLSAVADHGCWSYARQLHRIQRRLPACTHTHAHKQTHTDTHIHAHTVRFCTRWPPTCSCFSSRLPASA